MGNRAVEGEAPSRVDPLARYHAEGFAFPLDVLSREEAAIALADFEHWEHSLGGEVTGDLRFKPHLHLPFVAKLVHHPAIIEAVRIAVRSDNILLWSSDFNVKRANSAGFFSPHQDATYTGLEPAHLGVTVWLALSDPVDRKHGCMSFWPASHASGQRPHVDDGTDANNMLSRGQRVEEPSGGQGAAPVMAELRGGQASLHHFHLVHQSAPNEGMGTRVGLAMRFVAASVRQTGHIRELVTLVHGESEHEGFDLEPQLSPEASGEDCARGLDMHAEAMKRERQNYFEGADPGSSQYK